MILYNRIKRITNSLIGESRWERLRRLRKDIIAYRNRKNLNVLAKIYGTDKNSIHSYTQHYGKHFRKLRNKKIKILEIGVGGYNSPIEGGASLRMWKMFFRKGKIYGIDIYDKSRLEENRIKIFQGSQFDKSFLTQLIIGLKGIDIIIDDGSHINEHVIFSFKVLFPLLNTGGWYIVEDTQTSYWSKYGGRSDELNDTNTIMGFFKSLCDELNQIEIPEYESKVNFYNFNIESLFFYHNMIFIKKK